MIYIVTAIYHEAKPLIEYYNLKRTHKISKYQIFENDEIKLIISGTGVFTATIATTYLLTLFNAKTSDLILNIGVAGTKNKDFHLGQAFLCHKVIYHETNKSYYPDIIIKHPFSEGTLETFSQIVDKSLTKNFQGDLFDMEGAGFFEAASSFLPPHNIYLVKIVSDFLEPTTVSKEMVTKLINENLTNILKLIQNSLAINQVNITDLLTEDDYKLLSKIGDNLQLSSTMRHQLIQLAKQFIIRTKHNLSILDDFSDTYVESKYEGKKYFEQIKERLLFK
ncbi:hypothetical protein BHF71_06645 [Vulcanibacillus modesticaldus]|uniref:Nucleoside phosphorylase domain-containing protein n=1 Tax=Vulcanibacillus modesticaldus TaxID=337097 RepID=A0A1D2YWC2_9BACI|nr:hypothetical protein [Vulcanibacillus modesticaldus]OEG00035.1 hypothetical protein BHF71_06645 [Vulcanibacillus modesticaldus]